MINVGILGTGFGKTHAAIYQKLKGIHVIGIYGRSVEKLKTIEAELNIKTTTDIDELINDPRIDLIDVCLPTALHKAYVIKALKNNKHVFCETPVTYALGEAEEMKACAEEYNKKLFIDLFYKFSDPHRIAIETIHSKTLGEPIALRAYQKTPPYWGNMGLDKIVKDFMLHNFDFVTEIMDEPEEISAIGIEKENAHVFANLKYKNAIASVESSTLSPGSASFCIGFNIVCTRGTINFDGEFGETTKQKMTISNNQSIEAIDLPGKDDYQEVIKHMIECIENDDVTSKLSIDDAIKSLKIALAIKESLTHGYIVKNSN